MERLALKGAAAPQAGGSVEVTRDPRGEVPIRFGPRPDAPGSVLATIALVVVIGSCLVCSVAAAEAFRWGREVRGLPPSDVEAGLSDGNSVSIRFSKAACRIRAPLGALRRWAEWISGIDSSRDRSVLDGELSRDGAAALTTKESGSARATRER
ncbi:hypothetical protein ACFWCB_15640 [Streptomyces sp. NPDC060048]|uniref:hypothetical protein n=1 Tax=unclassified Streptomyces TaxID=2593676 RepID=UPI0036912B41